MVQFRFDCVFYYVRDLDVAVRFYERAFGLRVDSRDVVARFHVDGVLFELVPTNESGMLPGKSNARLALAVDDLDAAVAELLEKDVDASSIHVVTNGRFVTLQDPDGNEIMVWQYL